MKGITILTHPFVYEPNSFWFKHTWLNKISISTCHCAAFTTLTLTKWISESWCVWRRG